ncbi:MAG: hypothetical protein HY453_01945 [Parcubacteria group bacterium]|nr:hypothetical protein [Parcubacteria group bacterium]
MELLLDFAKLGKGDIVLAGGKGASLGEMTRAGIPVPPGFVILSTAFEEFLKETDLNVEIEAILDSVNHKKIHTVEDASEKIKTLVIGAETPEDIAEEIKKCFKKLGAKYVAVRSSATAEDSESASWAGQLESYLNTTEENLLENVKKCWASLFTPRAIFYRFEKDLHKQKISVAVVVQRMVESEKSGIAFSVHPVTQDRNQLIIEAGFGLGEAIVSGQITPDSYVVEKQPRRIIDQNIQSQARGLYRVKNGGNEWRDMPKEQRDKQVLSDSEILELSEIILAIENHYGFPCDIEWAAEKDEFYIVQSRPITTLSQDVGKYSIASTGTVEKFLAALKTQKLATPYFNWSPFILGNSFNTKKHFAKYYREPINYHVLLLAKKDKCMAFISEGPQPTTSQDFFKRYWKNTAEFDNRMAEYEKLCREVDSVYTKVSYDFIQKEDSSRLLLEMEKIVSTAWTANAAAFFSLYFDKDFCLNLLRAARSSVTPERLDVIWDTATAPVCDSFEKKHKLTILDLLQKKVSWKQIAEVCQYFTATYYDVALPEQAEKFIREQFESYADKITVEVEKAQREREDKIEEYSAFLSSLNDEEQKLVSYIQRIIELRDNRKDITAKSSVIMFRVAQRMFQDANIPDNLRLYVTFGELLEGVDWLTRNKDVLAKRADGFSMFIPYDGPIEFEYGGFEETKERLETLYLAQQQIKSTKFQELKGQTAYGGFVRGKVRIIEDVADATKFRKGEILVTGMTRPEFVPLIEKAVAIITNEGGITCHAAIVSREMKKPCIIGTKVATKLLRDGDMVEMDATAGIIKMLK